MNKNILLISAIAALTIGCDNSTLYENEDAIANISIKTVSDISESRATTSLPNSLTVAWSGTVTNSYTFQTVTESNFRQQTLRPGDYEFVAYNYNDENKATPVGSRGEAYYKSDVVSKTITTGVNELSMVAKVANAQIAITFDNTLTSIVSNWQATLFVEGVETRKILYSASETAPAWFPANKKLIINISYTYGGEDKSYTLTLPNEINVDGVPTPFDGTLVAGSAYTFNIGSSVADGKLTVTVNSTLSDANGFIPMDPTIDPEI